MAAAESLRAITYRRVSTDEQADSGLGLEAQAETIAAEVSRRGWTVAAAHVDEGRSAKTMTRPALAAALAALADGEADVLICSKLDRLSRSVADLATMADLASRQGWSLVVLDIDVDMTTAGGRLIANIMGSVAQWEREIIAERTAAALQVLKSQGKRLGAPVTLDEKRRQMVAALREEGLTLQGIADRLNSEDIPTARGCRWSKTTVARTLKSLQLDAEAEAAA